LARVADAARTVTITHRGDSEHWSDVILNDNGEYCVLYSDGMFWHKTTKTIHQAASIADADDVLADGITYKRYSTVEQTKLTSIESNAVSLTTVKADTDISSAISLKHAQHSDDETTTTIGSLISGAIDKNPPVDADVIGLSDSAAGGILRKLSWTNIKATLKSYFDTLYDALGAATSAVNAHKDLTTGVHGVGIGTIASVTDIAIDSNLSAAAQEAVSNRHVQNTDSALRTDKLVVSTTGDTSIAGSVDVAIGKVYKVNSVQVVTSQQSAIVDLPTTGNAVDTVAVKVNDILAMLRTHGLISST
jgi:hypothetical protein